MFSNSYFKTEVFDIAVDITGKRYSDYGMMWNELSLKTGIPRSILERYDDWYIINDEYYYFKDRCKIEELFMSELALECRVKCVQFLLAYDNASFGIISKLYREKDKKYYMYSDFCFKYLNDIPSSLGMFRLLSSIKLGDDKTINLMNDIFDLICFDMFCGQWDREEYNFFFECDRDNNIGIAPLCDNGIAFQNCLVYSSPFGELSLDEERISTGNLPCILSFEKYFYKKFALMLDINIDEILNRTCDKYKIFINNEDKRKLLNYFDDRKNAIDKTLRLI